MGNHLCLYLENNNLLNQDSGHLYQLQPVRIHFNKNKEQNSKGP